MNIALYFIFSVIILFISSLSLISSAMKKLDYCGLNNFSLKKRESFIYKIFFPRKSNK